MYRSRINVFFFPWSWKFRMNLTSVGECDFRFGWRLTLKWMGSLEVDVQCHVPMEPRRLKRREKKNDRCASRKAFRKNLGFDGPLKVYF